MISYGDLLFRSYVLRALVESKGEFSVVVDSSSIAETAGFASGPISPSAMIALTRLSGWLTRASRLISSGT